MFWIRWFRVVKSLFGFVSFSWIKLRPIWIKSFEIGKFMFGRIVFFLVFGDEKTLSNWLRSYEDELEINDEVDEVPFDKKNKSIFTFKNKVPELIPVSGNFR